MRLRVPRATLAVCLLSVLLCCSGCRHFNTTSHETSSGTADALRSAVGASKLPALKWPNFADYASQVQAFYAARNWDLAWIDGHKPTRQAQQLIQLFAASTAKGLTPEDYDASRWTERLAHLSTASDADLAQFDLALTVTTMRYISALHVGRVNPSHFAFGVSVDTKKYDLPQFLAQQVVGSSDVAKSLASIEPDTQEYRDTLAALAKYQALADKGKQQNWQPLPALTKPLAPGSLYPGASALQQRLQLLGDLSADTATDTATAGAHPSSSPGAYNTALANAVKHFQLRHDLPNDGKLTPQTIAALNVPLSVRVNQLEDSLERWRWLSNEYLNAPLLVNLPEFALRAYNEDHQVAFMMKVVVGDSVKEDHQTPVLTEQMKYVVMRPFWNVTPTIIKQEIVPHIERSKGYLAEKNFEVVNAEGKPVTGWTTAQLEHGLIVREKPGPKNSLGLIKFMFPNKYNIYLHSTPATELFDRTKRDFSHGCIRVQDPEKLAAWVLRNDPEWSPEKIHDAMESGPDNHTVPLKQPIPIVVFYATALFVEQGPEKGQVHFFDDIYGYDKDLENVLSQGMPYPVQPEPKVQDSDTN